MCDAEFLLRPLLCLDLALERANRLLLQRHNLLRRGRLLPGLLQLVLETIKRLLPPFVLRLLRLSHFEQVGKLVAFCVGGEKSRHKLVDLGRIERKSVRPQGPPHPPSTSKAHLGPQFAHFLL